MAQPTIYARIKKPVHTAFIKACEEENRSMTRQVEVVLIDWLQRREREKKAQAGAAQ